MRSGWRSAATAPAATSRRWWRWRCATPAGRPAPTLQLLIYPATDMRAIAPSHTMNGEGFLLTRDTIGYFRAHYVEPSQWDDWRASPLLHPDLAGLPPALRADGRLRPAARRGPAVRRCAVARRAPGASTSASSARSTASSRWAGWSPRPTRRSTCAPRCLRRALTQT
jgi:acetyl esterase/lipase